MNETNKISVFVSVLKQSYYYKIMHLTCYTKVLKKIIT